MKKTIIMPTINVPEVLRSWATSMSASDEIIVVDGSHPESTTQPHERISDLMRTITDEHGVSTRYITASDQTELGWASSREMGWYTTCRRNIALLEALSSGTDLIITLDDDNAATYDDQLSQVEALIKDPDIATMITKSENGWFDPGRLVLAKDAYGTHEWQPIHRGFPQWLRHDTPDVEYMYSDDAQIGVVAMLWTGAPDIDAIERMTLDPNVYFVDEGVKLAPKIWAPFDSQSTAYLAELAPLMMCWPGVGRYDDIWASYLARVVMDHLKYTVFYGRPAVHQDRNDHDLIRDLENEMHGMKYNKVIIETLKSIVLDENEANVLKLLTSTYDQFIDRVPHHALPSTTVEAFRLWLIDLHTIEKARDTQ